MARAQSGQVYLLYIEPPDQPNIFNTAPQDIIRERLVAGNRVTRYGRQWIVGKVQEAEGVLGGRIGFQGADATVEVWNDFEQDFLPSAHPVGLTAPSAIDLERLRIAVQPRGSDIKLNGLIGAFEALLSGDDLRWHIRGARRTTSFEEWRATVIRVTNLRLVLRRPNPHYRDTPNLEAVMEQARAEVVAFEAQNHSDGIDTDSPFLQETRAHVENDYGEARYTGVREHGGEQVVTHYSSTYGSEDESQEVEVDPETGEASQETLRTSLAREPEVDQTENDGDA